MGTMSWLRHRPGILASKWDDEMELEGPLQPPQSCFLEANTVNWKGHMMECEALRKMGFRGLNQSWFPSVVKLLSICLCHSTGFDFQAAWENMLQQNVELG